MSASRTLLDELKQDDEFSHAVSIIERARPGTKCHELRERLAGGHGGRQITLLAPSNDAVKRAAEAKRTTIDVFCKMPEVAEALASHAVLDRWPLAALRMLGGPLESLQSQRLAFLPSGAKVSVKLAGSRARPVGVNFGDINCKNGLLHKMERFLMPAREGWQGAASREEIVKQAHDSHQEMLKDRRLLNGDIWAGPPPPGPVSRAIAARRTASAHDRQRAQAFAPLYGDDYEPRIYTGNKPPAPKRDATQLRTVAMVSRDKSHLGQAPTRDDVWEEWEPLRREEIRLQSELEDFHRYLQSKEAVIAEHSAFIREVLPPAGLGWARSQKPLIEVLVSSAEEHQFLQSSLSREDPTLITSEVRLKSCTVPAKSRLCSELPPWTSKVWLTLELPEVLPDVTFPLWSAPSDEARGMESRLQHLEAHLLIEQAVKALSSDEREDVAELAGRIAKEADSMKDVLSWLERHGIRWGLADRRKFARLCEAMENVSLGGPQGSRLAFSNEEANVDEHLQDPYYRSLLHSRIDKSILTKALSLPVLPEDHSELQALMAHLRHLSSLVAPRSGQVVANLKQEVNAHSESIDILRGRLEVLESSVPSQWSPPVALWKDLLGASPPPSKAADALNTVSEAVAEARRKAVRNGEETAVKAEALKASATEKLRQVTWLEAQAASREAEIELLKQHLHEQADRLKELEVEHREGRNRTNMLNRMDAEEAERRASVMALEHHAAKVQKAWRQRQRQAGLKLNAVLRLQFQVRRWRKRRRAAAQKIQTGWQSWLRTKLFKRKQKNQGAR